MKTIILPLIGLILTSCTMTPSTPSTPPAPVKMTEETKSVEAVTPATVKAIKNCICVKMWLPVCGSDNKTYGNACEARCAGVKYTQGACEAKK